MLESKSAHSVTKAICEWISTQKIDYYRTTAENIEEIPGYGLKRIINGKTVLAGNTKLLKKFEVACPDEIDREVETIVAITIDGKFSDHFVLCIRPELYIQKRATDNQFIERIEYLIDQTKLTPL